jgi:hypothetical protein
MARWVLLHYKIPPVPSARRVYVWRKLKRLGAVLVQDAVWVLPATERTREQFQWLAAEIEEQGGEALYWEARLLAAAHEEALRGLFAGQVDGEYQAILVALQEPEADLAALARRYQQVQAADYFQSALGRQVRATLLAGREGRDG